MALPPIEMLHATRQRLLAERRDLLGDSLPAARALVALAQDAGDIGENPDVQIALFEVARIESRIAYLDDVLARAVMHEPELDAGDTVRYGSVVTVEFAPGEQERYLLAGFEDRVEGLETLTLSSPLGAAVHGSKVGERVEVNGPSGRFEVTVHAIETM